MAAPIWADRVAETTTTTGTGALTLAAAITGYRRFSVVMAVSDTCYYTIVGIDSNGVPTGEWECGLGTYSSTNTLTRTTVQSSSTGSAVSFSSGTKRVALTANATAMKFRGALVKKSTDQTAANYTTATAVAWDAEDYDTDSIHDTATNNSRLTVPSGVARVRLTGCINTSLMTNNLWTKAYFTKNGSVFLGSAIITSYSGNGAAPALSLVSPVISVVAGDFFELVYQVSTDTSITVDAVSSHFALEIIE